MCLLYFILFNGADTVYRGDDKDLTRSGKEEKMVFSGTPSFFLPSYAGPITAMSFIFDNDDFDHFAFDNLQFRVMAEPAGPGQDPADQDPGDLDPGTPPSGTVPVPASAPRVVLGLGLLTWRRRFN